MAIGDIAAGQRWMWHLAEKLGEGDAGEVFLVESTLEGKQAILKRPRRNSFASDVLRQAGQIRTEGNILKAMSGASLPAEGTRLVVPSLLDQSTSEEGLGERFFIVVGRAPGYDIKTLAQWARSGKTDGVLSPVDEKQRFFVDKLVEGGELPAPLLIRILYAAAALLDTIHAAEMWTDNNHYGGIIWNDVKPEHLYWDAEHACLTVIDWGNAQFLETDHITKDRRYSALDDGRQFIQALGTFLSEVNPALSERLEWPREASLQSMRLLLARLAALHTEVTSQLSALRSEERDLYSLTQPQFELLAQSESIQRRIVAFGEMPDFSGAINLHTRLLLQLASENKLKLFHQICEQVKAIPTAFSEKWDLMAQVAHIALRQKHSVEPHSKQVFANGLAAGIADDCPTMVWMLAESIGDGPLPEWWERICQGARLVCLKLDKDEITPYVEINRLYLALQSTVVQMGDKIHRSTALGNDEAAEKQLHLYEDLVKRFNEDVLKKWVEVDPPPPHANISYDALDRLIDEVEDILPGASQTVNRALAQPRAHAELALNAWERKEFELTSRALCVLLLWDPDRRRLLWADRSIGYASQWLLRLQKGADSNEPFYDFVATVELAGRLLRNRVGPAQWLDRILEVLKRLRKGARHADLILEHPEILIDMPWLNEQRSREMLTLPHTRPIRSERGEEAPGQASLVSGVVEGKLGKGKDLHLTTPLDTWVPEARGSSARVFLGSLQNRAGQPFSYAVKVMRPERAEYALPLFKEEAQILSMLRDVPGVTPLVELGYLRIDKGQEFPSDERHTSAESLRGQVVRFGGEEVQNYLASMDRYLTSGWVPYLALPQRKQEYNLMVFCDAGYTHGWFLPLRESLVLGIQICDILQSAHDRNIVYRDHKILHYYWEPEAHAVVMIDWNIAKRLPAGLTDAERQSDLAQFGARALHHIFTGRPALGALPLGPNRPEEIENSALSYSVSWTYDDERLPNRVKEILEQVLTQGYTNLRELRQDLLQVLEQIPDSAPSAQ